MEDTNSLNDMAKKGRVVLNCVGPYRYNFIEINYEFQLYFCSKIRFFGEAVVKACVDFGASHVDISGEPQVLYFAIPCYYPGSLLICEIMFQYLERMQLDYNQSARDNKVYVVGACGFDSIPADMGTVFLENKFGGQVNSVETYLHVYPRVSKTI